MDHDDESRRDRLRRELRRDVLAAADRQLSEGGPASVTWRGVARAIRMSPAALYTYYDDLDALLDALAIDAFGRLAATVRSAVDHFVTDAPGDRALAGALAYRRWLRHHPRHVELMYRPPRPGQVPTEAVSSAQVAVVAPLVEALAPAVSAPRPVGGHAAPGIERFVGVWATLHGLATLEVAGHLDWLDTDRVVEERLRDAIVAVGAAPPDAGTAARFAAWSSTVAP